MADVFHSAPGPIGLTGPQGIQGIQGIQGLTGLTGPNSANTYNVANYGAVGNGSTDDTAAIQAAITAAHGAGGGVVYLPPGNYKLTATITIYSGVSIVGCGMYESVFKRTGDYGNTFVATLVDSLYFARFAVQQTISYTPGTPGSASNMATSGAHFSLLGVTGAIFDQVRFQDGFQNLSITGGARILCYWCGFVGTYDSRSSAPKATLYNYVIQPYNATYGVPTFMRLYGCDFMGSNNGTTNTSVNYSGINSLTSIYIACVEDFEMIGGFLGGSNSVNIDINASSSSPALLNIRLIGVRFDSANTADVFFTGDGTCSAQAVSIAGCIFDGELAGHNAVLIGNPATGSPVVSGLSLSNNIAYAYLDTEFNLQDGKGVNVTGNTLHYYNNSGNAASSLASGVYIGGRCTGFKVTNNLIGGSQSFGDYDNSSNKCLFGVFVAAFGTTNVGVINGNSTPTPNSIGTASDLVFLSAARSAAFAALPPTPPTGAYALVTDSNTATWGATVAAGGSNKVLALFNGTTWTVAGK